MAASNPRIIGTWSIPNGVTTELTTATSVGGTAIWPKNKINVEIGATTQVPYGVGFGKTTAPTVFVPRWAGSTLTMNSMVSIGNDTTGQSANSPWINQTTGGAIIIYVFATDETN